MSLRSQAAPACQIYFGESISQLSEAQVRSAVTKSNKYLDKRNQDWSERNKCLCCHTTLPYMLTRSYDSNSKKIMEKFKDIAIARIENNRLQPWYHADHAGKNSRPTETVVSALTLLMYDLAKQQPLSDITLKAIDKIFEFQNSNGRLHWLDFELQPFESKKGELWGNSMAILAIEIAQKNSNYRAPERKYNKLKDYVLKNNIDNLKPQEMAVLLWANANSAVEPLLNTRRVSRFVRKIILTQNENGSWNEKTTLGQGRGEESTYATAISLIGLVKANMGKTTAAHKAAKWLTEQQERGRFLGYQQRLTLWTAQSMNRENALLNNRFASDIATSYSALALQMYGREVLSDN